MEKRRNHDAGFKARVALEAVKGERTVSELAVEYSVQRLMRLMRLMTIYQKPDTSRPAKGHKTFPYLLGGL